MIGEKQRYRVTHFNTYMHRSKKFYICAWTLEHETGAGIVIRMANKDLQTFLPYVNSFLAAMDEPPMFARTVEVFCSLATEKILRHKHKYVAIDTVYKSYLDMAGDDVESAAFASTNPFSKTFQKLGANFINKNQ